MSDKVGKETGAFSEKIPFFAMLRICCLTLRDYVRIIVHWFPKLVKREEKWS